MKTLVIGTYLLEFTEFLIILMIVHDLMTLGKDDNFSSSILRTVKWTFILAVAIRFLSFLLGFIESMVYFQHIRENTNEFNQLRTVIDAGQSFLLISNITKLISLLIISYAFFQLRNYFNELTTRYAEPEFQRASNAIEKVALAQFPFVFAILFIFTPADFLSLMFSAIGLILLVYGYLVTGKALSNMRPKLSKVPEKYYRI